MMKSLQTLEENQPRMIDALPYIDTDIDVDEDKRNLVMQEVDDEMEVFPPTTDYLAHLPDFHKRTFCTELISKEHDRLETGLLAEPDTQLSQINIDTSPIPANIGDAEKANLLNSRIRQLKIKVIYQSLQTDYLGKIAEFKEQVDKSYIEFLSTLFEQTQCELDLISKQTQEVNWERKIDQEKIGKTLKVLKEEWTNILNTNAEIKNSQRDN